MIKQYSYLKVIDNSGARTVMCISTFTRKTANIGDIIKVSVKSTYPNSKIARKTMHRAMIVQTARNVRCEGYAIRFLDNAVILLDDTGTPVANTITKPIPSFLKIRYPSLSKLSAQLI